MKGNQNARVSNEIDFFEFNFAICTHYFMDLHVCCAPNIESPLRTWTYIELQIH